MKSFILLFTLTLTSQFTHATREGQFANISECMDSLSDVECEFGVELSNETKARCAQMNSQNQVICQKTIASQEAPKVKTKGNRMPASVPVKN